MRRGNISLSVLASGTPEPFWFVHLGLSPTSAISRDAVSLGSATPASRVCGRLTSGEGAPSERPGVINSILTQHIEIRRRCSR